MDPISTGGSSFPYGCGCLLDDPELDAIQDTAERLHQAVLARGLLPSKFDTLDDWFLGVRDQGKQGACVAFATMAICEKLEHDDTTKLTDRLATQYMYNLRPNYPQEGMYISDIWKVLRVYGSVPEWKFPYGKKVGGKDTVPEDLISLGKKHQFEVANITSLPQFKASIVERDAGVLLSFPVWNDSRQFWKKREGDKLQGGHAVAAVAYDDDAEAYDGTKGVITLLNSWGKDWGKKGFTHMSYKDFLEGAHHRAVAIIDVKGSPPFPQKPEDDKKKRKCCVIV